MSLKSLIVAAAALLLTFLPGLLSAQGIHTTARNLGMGGGGGAYMSGYHANFINPANLMLPERSTRWSVGVIGGLSTAAGGGLVNIGLYNEHFTTGKLIDSPTAMSIADDWFGSGAGSMQYMGLNLDIVPVGVSYRRQDMAFSTAFRIRTMATQGINRGLFELGLLGLNPEVFGEPRDINLKGELLAAGELSFGYAMEVWRNQDVFQPGAMRVYAGIAPKIVFGFEYGKFDLKSRLGVYDRDSGSRIEHDFEYVIHTVGSLTEDMDAYYQERRVRNNADAELGDYVEGDSFFDPGKVHGSGLAMDLGGTFEWYMQDVSIPVIGDGPQILRASFSITDLGGINFSNQAGTFSAKGNFIWEGLTLDYDYINENYDEVSDYIDYVLQDSIASDIYGNFAPGDLSSYRVGLNPMMHLGGSVTMGKFTGVLDIGKGFNNRGINSRRMYSALGAEYRIVNIVPVRMGMRMGGYSSVNLSAGTGISLKNFEFTTSVMSTPRSSRSGANISAAWSGMVIRF